MKRQINGLILIFTVLKDSLFLFSCAEAIRVFFLTEDFDFDGI